MRELVACACKSRNMGQCARGSACLIAALHGKLLVSEVA